jgi:uncharacterized damage-inducible protein DinB
MAEATTTLARFYHGWETYQGYLTQALTPLTQEQLSLRAAPNLRPIWVLAAHIIAARVYWFHQWMGEGAGDLAPLQAWDDDGQPLRTSAELGHGLEATWAMIQDCLARWTVDDLDQTFTVRRGQVTRQWIIWHVIEHDLHHGGELFFTLGMHGLPTPDL